MKYRILSGLPLLLAAPAVAQEAGQSEERQQEIVLACARIPDNEITVVAVGAPQRVEESGQSISVVDIAEIESVQGADLTRVLERLPGVSFSRNGGLGAQTGLNVRGANADQVLVMVDGVRIADYSSPGGGYDLGNLMTGGVGKVELLRGSNSVVWGSQAMGGVLAVTTREETGVAASAEYGAWDTAIVDATAGIAQDSHAVSLSAGYATTDGYSAQRAGSEVDGYEQWHVAGRGRVQLAEGLNLNAVGRYADSTLDIDLTGPNAADVQTTREGTGRLGFDYDGQGFSLTGGVALSDVRRHYETGWGPSSYKGQSRRAELRGSADLTDGLELHFGAESEWSRAESTYDSRRKARLSSGHALLAWTGGPVNVAAGARLDDHDRFGSHWTFGANGSFELADNLRLRASYGEGFKAPTLYQLFGSWVGNAALQPERSRSYDAGIELGTRNQDLHVALTVFRRDSRNLIDLDAFFTYGNVARARAQGFELEAGAKVSEHFAVQAAYTWTKARDLSALRDLSRRPRHLLSVSADWETPLAGLKLGADLRLAGDAVEYDWLGTPTPLDGYAVTTLRAALPVGEHVELFGRVENVGDVQYETAAGYATPGRSAHIGARARF